MYISEQLLIHFRNIRGGYSGPLCPDHVPVSELDEGRERFMSFALGYTRGLLQAAGVWSTSRR